MRGGDRRVVGTLLHVELAVAVATTFILCCWPDRRPGLFLREVSMAVQAQTHVGA